MNKFDKNGFALENCRVQVHNYTFDKKEYYSSTIEHVVEGSGIPAHSTLIENLESKDGFTQVFNEGKQVWEYVADHRYKTAYDINTKQSFEIDYFGELKEEHTLLAPPSFDHEFIDGAWIITEEKQAELAAQEKQSEVDKLENELNQLRQDLIFAQAMGDDISDIVARVKEVREELEKLK